MPIQVYVCYLALYSVDFCIYISQDSSLQQKSHDFLTWELSQLHGQEGTFKYIGIGIDREMFRN